METDMETKQKTIKLDPDDLNHLQHVLHLLRDVFPGTYDAIGERMDVNEDALNDILRHVGVPDDNYNDGMMK
jgi:hypothetical protein